MSIMKLQERFTISKADVKKLPLKEKEIVVEKDGTQYKCRGAYEIPVWRLGEKNLNERIYSKHLAEKLIEENSITLGLANHPKDEADVLNTFAVEKNPHIKEGIFYVDAYFVGENGQLANEIMEAGGQIGLSSSAYGDVDDNGYVMTEGFSIERFADWVDTPSFQVYAAKDTSISNEEQTIESTEERDENNKLFSENVTNNSVEEEQKVDKKKENQKEILMSDTEKKMSIEEKNLKLGVKKLFEDANSVEDLKEKRNKYEEILEYCDGVEFASDYIQEANDKISEIDEKMYELADKGKEVDSLKENSEKEKGELQEQLEEKTKQITEMEEKYDKAVQMLDDLKLREKKINEMYKVVVAEKNGMVKPSDYNELYKYSEKVEEELEELKKEVRKLRKENKSLSRKARVSERKDTSRVYGNRLSEEVEENVEETSAEKNIEEQEENYEVFNNSPNFDEIVEWYENKVRQFPRIKEFKEEILTKRTLMEAQRTFLKFKDIIEESPSPYKSPYYGSGLSEEEEKEEPKKTYTSSLKIREGWM